MSKPNILIVGGPHSGLWIANTGRHMDMPNPSTLPIAPDPLMLPCEPVRSVSRYRRECVYRHNGVEHSYYIPDSWTLEKLVRIIFDTFENAIEEGEEHE